MAQVKTVAHTWSILMGGAWWLVTLVAPLGGCCATQTLSAKPLRPSYLHFALELLYFWRHPVCSRCNQESVYDSLVVSLLNIVDTSSVASGMNWVAAKAVIFRSVKTYYLRFPWKASLNTFHQGVQICMWQLAKIKVSWFLAVQDSSIGDLVSD